MGPINRWAMDREGAYLVYGKPLADSCTNLAFAFEPPEGASRQHEQEPQVWRVYPKQRRCSPFGDANGVRLPWAA